MKAVVYPRANEFAYREVDDLPIRPGHVRVAVKSTTICATDQKVLAGLWPKMSFPHIAGHEWAGQVVDVGPGVTGLRPGDRVGVEVHCGCGSCPRCIEGMYTLCDNYGDQAVGHAHIGLTTWGGFADHAVIPAKACHRLPDGLDYDAGAFTDNIGIALWAVERARLRPGERVAVVGPGAFGLLAVQVARAMGAGLVVLVGTRPDRLAMGEQLGADLTVNARAVADPVAAVRDACGGGRGADAVIEFAGTPEAAAQALQMARRGGRVVLAGATAPGRELRVDLSVIVRGHLDVVGSLANPQGVSRRGLELIRRGLVRIAPLITHHMSLGEFDRAWRTFTAREGGAIRVMMHPEGA